MCGTYCGPDSNTQTVKTKQNCTLYEPTVNSNTGYSMELRNFLKCGISCVIIF